MKNSLILLSICFLAFSFTLPSNKSTGVKFNESGWSATVKQAKEQNKPIFVFVRTYTCQISARMDDVFEDPTVAAFFNENFVCIQLNPDKPLENLRVSNWGATGVPTFFFFNTNKDKITSFNGYREPAAVIKEAEKALKMMGIKDYKRGTVQKTDPNKKSNKKEDDDDDDDDKK